MKTFFIKLKHYILLSQLRNGTVNYLWHLLKKSSLPSFRLNFLTAKGIPFEKEDSFWRQNSTLPSTLYFAGWKCWLSMNKPDKTNYWRSLLQTFNRSSGYPTGTMHSGPAWLQSSKPHVVFLSQNRLLLY